MASFSIPANSALLLEGGSLRGMYTSGVLDLLMEQDLYFPTVAGVSAGALNGMNYVAHQPGRSASINLRYRHDPRYLGPLAMVRSGSVFGLNFLLHDLLESEPYDTTQFWSDDQRFVVVASCMETGKPAYLEKNNTSFDFMQAIRASATLPLVSAPVELEGKRYLDGGVTCPIPVGWALQQGFEKLVIITTRQKGFRKAMPTQRDIDLYSDFYSKYPLFLAQAITQELRYNQLMDSIDTLEEQGRAFVLRPAQPVGIGRFEGNIEKLLDLYNTGRKECRAALPALQAFLQG